MFKSSSVVLHLLKGLAGFGFLTIALRYSQDLEWWTVAPALAALVCFRGCPMCWTVGLIETVIDPTSGTGCVDGSCANDKDVSGFS